MFNLFCKPFGFLRYGKSSYYHNESGFQTGTPYGDTADILLTDAPGWLLAQYAVVVLGSPLRVLRAELAEKLQAYVEGGGTLVLTGSALASGVPILGLELDANNRTGGCSTIPPHTNVTVQHVAPGAGAGAGTTVVEPVPVAVCQIWAPHDATPLATVHGGAVPLALMLKRGNGTVIALASTGVAATAQGTVPLKPLPNGGVDTALQNPFPMAAHARTLLDQVLRAQTPFDAGAAMALPDGLAVVATRVGKGEYLVSVSNHGLAQQDFALTSRLGSITALSEVELQDSWMNAANTNGYMATHTPNNTDLGKSTATAIAGLDARIFKVVVDESDVSLISHAQATPPRTALGGPPARGVGLPLSSSRPIQEQLLLRPSFTQHFDTVVVDWRHIERTEAAALAEEGRWLFRQNISVVVDFTSGINLYPDLRLINNSADEYMHSMQRMEQVLLKAGTKLNASTASAPHAMYSKNVIWSLHRTPENDYTATQCQEDFQRTAIRLSAMADALGITLHLRTGVDGKPPHTLAAAEAFWNKCSQPPNLKLAVSTAMLVGTGVGSVDLTFIIVPPFLITRLLNRISDKSTKKMAQNLNLICVLVPARSTLGAGAKTRLRSRIRSLRHIAFAGRHSSTCLTAPWGCGWQHSRCTIPFIKQLSSPTTGRSLLQHRRGFGQAPPHSSSGHEHRVAWWCWMLLCHRTMAQI